MSDSKFRTINGYDRQAHKSLTRAMEDYLEMICRYSQDEGYIRISKLSALLNVKPSSASKMAEHLKEEGYVEYEKYGFIKPTAKGWDIGGYLLHRHSVLHEFLRYLNGSEDELEQVELIEHFINRETTANLEKLLNHLKSGD